MKLAELRAELEAGGVDAGKESRKSMVEGVKALRAGKVEPAQPSPNVAPKAKVETAESIIARSADIRSSLEGIAKSRKTPAIWVDHQLITPDGKYEVKDGKLSKVQELSKAGWERNLENVTDTDGEGKWWGRNDAAKAVMETRDRAKADAQAASDKAEAIASEAKRETDRKDADRRAAIDAAYDGAKFEPVSLKIATNGDKNQTTVAGQGYKGLVVHKAFESDGWAVAHEQSGKTVGWARTRDDAKRLVVRLSELADWKQSASELDKGSLAAKVRVANQNRYADLTDIGEPQKKPPRKAQAGPSGPPPKSAMGAAAGAELAGNRFTRAFHELVSPESTNKVSDAAGSIRAAFSREAMPITSKLSQASADAGVKLASAQLAAEPVARASVSEVLTPKQYGSPEFLKKFGTMLAEDRLRGQRAAFEKAGDTDAAANVTTLVGSAGSPFKTEADYQAAWKNPELLAAAEKHKAGPQQVAEDIHKELAGQLGVKGEHGTFVNMRTIDPTDPEGRREMKAVGGSSGNLRNQRLQKSAFVQPFKGTGKAYETSYDKLIQNTTTGNIARIAKKGLVDQLVNDGLGKVLDPGDAYKFNEDTFERWPTINGRRAARIEGVVDYGSPQGKGEDATQSKVRKDLYVDPRIETEVRKAMGVDKSGLGGSVAKMLGSVLNPLQMKSLVDPTFHSANIVSAVSGSPGGASLAADLARKVPGLNLADAVTRISKSAMELSADTPEVRQRLAYLAENGMMRKGHGVIGKLDQAGRLTLDSMYSNLVERGVAPDTVAGRRKFVNQIGQYNPRLMGPVESFFKESGLSPFIVAGKTFNNLAIKRAAGFLGLDTGNVKPETLKAQVTLRTTQLVGAAMTYLIAPGVINYMAHGSATIPGVPIGAIYLGKTDDGKVRYLDPAQWIGLRRGLRMTGVNAMVEGKRAGLTTGESSSRAVNDAFNAALHPWAGPVPEFGTRAATGGDLSLPAVERAGKAKPGDSQAAKNFLYAAEQTNPMLAGGVEGYGGGGGIYGALKGSLKSLGGAFGYHEVTPINAAKIRKAEQMDYRFDQSKRRKRGG